jgi:hypothetical protein
MVPKRANKRERINATSATDIRRQASRQRNASGLLSSPLRTLDQQAQRSDVLRRKECDFR